MGEAEDITQRVDFPEDEDDALEGNVSAEYEALSSYEELLSKYDPTDTADIVLRILPELRTICAELASKTEFMYIIFSNTATH